MSIDNTIKELMSSVAALTEATNKNTGILERVLAGQEAAMAKLESGSSSTAKRETAAQKKTREAAEKAAEQSETTPTPADPAPKDATPVLLASPSNDTAKNAKGEDQPTAKYRAADFSRQEVKNEFVGWLGEVDDVAERKQRADFVKAISEHFGVAQPFHPDNGLVEEDQRKQTLFFLRRKREGLKVDFGAEYDFDGDPLADQTVEADGEGEGDVLG